VANLLKRFIFFYGLWLVISEARAGLLAIGVLAALAATAVSLSIWRKGGRQLSIFALLGYLPGFLWRSVKGGLDVAWRVFHPRLPIAPAFVAHDSRDPDETGWILFTDALSLMPGTLGAGLSGRRATVHLIADAPPARRLIAEEDARVARLFAGTGEEDGR
jgi:multicomponent Na+:H+ antiporter subunit E